MKYSIFTIPILLILPASALAEIDLPVENGVVTSGVGWRVDPFGSGKLVFHRGAPSSDSYLNKSWTSQ